MDKYTIQKRILELLPLWHYQVNKPIKQLLNDDMTLEIYYSILLLEWLNRDVTLSEFGKLTMMKKQQVTKVVNKLEEKSLVERYVDTQNRRTVWLKLTDGAHSYVEQYVNNVSCFDDLTTQISDEDKVKLEASLQTIIDIFVKLPQYKEIIK